MNEIDWDKVEAVNDIPDDPTSFSNDYSILYDQNNEYTTTIINEFDTSEINIIGVEKNQFANILEDTKLEDNNFDLDSALSVYISTYIIVDEPNIV